MTYKNYNNTYVRSLYSPGYSFIVLSLYKTSMILGFTPWIGGAQQYDKRRFQSTSIDYEKAAALCLLAKPILEGRQNNPVRYAIPCNNQTSLMLELKTEQDGQMRAYLIIEKKKAQVVF